jgi:hypothetical protein
MRTYEVEMSDGKVACPYSPAGRVDVETCYRCPRLRAFHDEESETRVVCARPALRGFMQRVERLAATV